MRTIEQHLDIINYLTLNYLAEAKKRPLILNELKESLIEKSSDQFNFNPNDFKIILNEIECLFDSFPNIEIKSFFQQFFEDSINLDGNYFSSWQHLIQFDNSIIDDLRIGYLCGLYDLEFGQFMDYALKACNPTKFQEKLTLLQIYLNMVEGFYSKTLNVFIYAMIKKDPSSFKALIKGLNIREKRKTELLNGNFEAISELELSYKLTLLQNIQYTEISNIAKICNRELRNAIVHREFRLDETNDLIIYKNQSMGFNEFKESARKLNDYRLFISLSFHYYSMKCYFESNGLL